MQCKASNVQMGQTSAIAFLWVMDRPTDQGNMDQQTDRWRDGPMNGQTLL